MPFTANQLSALQHLATPDNLAYRQGFASNFQRALTGVRDPGQYYDQASGAYGSAGQSFDQAGNLVAQGTAPITTQQVGQSTLDLLNPARAEVQDRTMAGLEQARRRTQAQTLARTPGGSSFGNTAQGVNAGVTNESFANAAANTLADLNYRTFDAAQGRATDLLTGNAGRALTGAQTATGVGAGRVSMGNGFAGLGSSAMNNIVNVGGMAQTGEGIRRQGVLDELAAGGIQYDQGQKYLDAITGERKAEDAYQGTQLDSLINRLKAAFSGEQQIAGTTPNGAQVAGGLGMVASQLDWTKLFSPDSSPSNAYAIGTSGGYY